MIVPETHINHVLLELYRGVVAPHSWTRALDLISQSFRGSAIFFGRLAGDGSSSMEGHGIEDECTAMIGGPLATPQANPFIRTMVSKPIGKAVPTQAMCGDAALVRSDLYEQGLQPYGQRYALGAMLERIEGNVRTVSLTRPGGEGDYAEDEIGCFNLFLPHLARAIELRETFAGVQAQSAAAFSALDSIERGIVILSGNFRIVFANREAHRIFALNDGLRATADGLSVSDRRAAHQLRASLQAIASEDAFAVGALPAPICVPRPSAKLPYALSFVPAPELLDRSANGGGAPISVTIIDPERKTSASIALLRQIYGLTPAEANLAGALCDHDLKLAAAQLGITINTAKTQLQAIFQKVGVSRQSALVRIVSVHCVG